MKNKELYGAEIVDMLAKKGKFAVTLDNQIKECSTESNDCNFPNNNDCYDSLSKWLNEEVDFLTSKEREYLSVVIKPFRDSIEWIRKKMVYFYNPKKIISSVDYLYDDYYLEIKYIYKDTEQYVQLSATDNMYKGLEENRLYKIEDLGL